MASIGDTCGGGRSIDGDVTVCLTRVAGAGGTVRSAGAGILSGSAQTVVDAVAGVSATIVGVGGRSARIGGKGWLSVGAGGGGGGVGGWHAVPVPVAPPLVPVPALFAAVPRLLSTPLPASVPLLDAVLVLASALADRVD